ncbi:MAG TPA: hypothetical protein VK003_10990 [Oceanobacillus sp.]|nr:hypothetical protein [Oceanobacillus sp.]
MELSELVELLYTARERFTTIQVAWQYWYQPDKMNIITERWAASKPSGSVAVLKSKSTSETESSVISRYFRRVWWQKPDCWRDEDQREEGGSTITIICGGKWWAFSPGIQTLYTNVTTEEPGHHQNIREIKIGSAPDIEDRIDDIPLLDPSFLLASHDLQIISDTVHAERDAIQIKAIYRKGKSRSYEPMFWSTADEYELLIDKERGILLRYAAKLAGEEFAVASVDQVSFDQPIPERIFTFSI